MTVEELVEHLKKLTHGGDDYVSLCNYPECNYSIYIRLDDNGHIKLHALDISEALLRGVKIYGVNVPVPD